MTVEINAVAEPVLETTDKNAKRRKGPTPPTKRLLARQREWEDTVRSVDTKLKQGFHKPGSMNRAK